MFKKLYIDHNNITDYAADDIGFTLSCNGELQGVNISKNAFNKECHKDFFLC